MRVKSTFSSWRVTAPGAVAPPPPPPSKRVCEKLAFTSNKPGCTQALNFYRVDSLYNFVDLTGYGYARVPEEIRLEWKKLIESYLLGRKAMELSVLVLDARRA